MDIYTPEKYRLVYTTKIDFGGRRASYNEIHLMQYDRVLPVIACELYFDGNDYTLGANANAKVRWWKSDNTFVYKDVLGCSADRRIIYFEIDEQMAAVHGKPEVIIELIDNAGINGNGSGINGSSHVNIVVDRNPIKEKDIVSASEVVLATVAKTGDYNDLKNKPTVEGVSKEYVQAEDQKVKDYADGKITTEATARESADTTLDSKITKEISDREAAIRGVSEGVDEKIQNIKDTVIPAAIESEASRAKAAEIENKNAIVSESQTRDSADKALETKISNEATTRETADGKNHDDIVAEATAREAADTAEAKARADKDTEIEKSVAEEATARAEGDTANDTAIKAEATRAKQAEADLNTSKQSKADLDNDVAALKYVKSASGKITEDTKVDGESVVDANHVANIDLKSRLEPKQDKSKLVTELNEESTDEQYPSAKCMFDRGLKKINVDGETETTIDCKKVSIQELDNGCLRLTIETDEEETKKGGH